MAILLRGAQARGSWPKINVGSLTPEAPPPRLWPRCHVPCTAEVPLSATQTGQARMGGCWHALQPVHIAVTSKMVAEVNTQGAARPDAPL